MSEKRKITNKNENNVFLSALANSLSKAMGQSNNIDLSQPLSQLLNFQSQPSSSQNSALNSPANSDANSSANSLVDSDETDTEDINKKKKIRKEKKNKLINVRSEFQFKKGNKSYCNLCKKVIIIFFCFFINRF
jgi:hypothetical protein